MSLNLMEVIRSYELAEEGTVGVYVVAWQCVLHVNVILNQITRLPEMSDEEEAMLSEAFYVKDNSRLGCQIQLSHVDGLNFEIAPSGFALGWGFVMDSLIASQK